MFPGVAFGAPLAAGGDLVVNTSQTGYQEVCTDPSYAGQVVVMTYPAHRQLRPARRRRPVDDARGYGRSSSRTPPPPSSRTPASSPLLLRDDGIPAIAGVDTRALARHLRANEWQPARDRHRARRQDDEAARAAARPSRAGRTRTSWRRSRRRPSPSTATADEGGPLVGIVDLGLKSNIVRAMRHRGARVRVFPTRPTASDVLTATSTGSSCRRARAIRAPRDAGRLARAVIDDGRPLLGICLGHQIVGRAAGRIPGACGSAITARTTRSRTSTSGSSRSRRRTTRSRSSASRSRRRVASA